MKDAVMYARDVMLRWRCCGASAVSTIQQLDCSNCCHVLCNSTKLDDKSTVR